MNIIVIGDILLDINYISEVTRKAPEADIPVYNILDKNYILGGAANVAQNLHNLEPNVEIIGVVGNDIYGTIVTDLLNIKNINHKLFIDQTRNTTQKHRIFLETKLHVRYDIEDKNDISEEIQKEIIKYISSKKVDAIIISDYDKGVITEYLSQSIIKYSNQNNILTFVDPKIKNYMKYKHCFLFKPNLHEAETISGEKNITKMLDFIKNKIQSQNTLLTLAEEGMVLNTINNKIEDKEKRAMIDVTGAGDVVLVVVVYVFLKTNDLLKACKAANYIAGKSIGVIGNYNINLRDIDEFFNIDMEQKCECEKIVYYEKDEIEKDANVDNNYNNPNNQTNNNKIINIKNLARKMNKSIVFTNGCFDILHSAHIELLQFAKKQGDILVVGLNSDNSIKRLKGETRPVNDVNERSRILSLFEFIDYVIIFEEDTPLNLIKTLTPDYLIKGSDYNMTNIIGKEYVKNVVFFNYIQNKSSTLVINKIKK